VQIQRSGRKWASAEYSTFSISDEIGQYQLTVDGYSGDASNAMMTHSQYPNKFISNGKMFSTPDRDNDESPGRCAAQRKNGWWHDWCSISDVNLDGVAYWRAAGMVKTVRASRMLVKLI